MRVYIALGSNILPEANLVAAADLLRGEWPDIRFAHVYRSAPAHHANQDDFLNTAAAFAADRDMESTAGKLRQIEDFLGKSIAFRFGPRTIDLDLLLYGNDCISSPEITVPHPRMHERRFVLEPLCELLDTATKHPVLQKTWSKLLVAVQDQECQKMPLTL